MLLQTTRLIIRYFKEADAEDLFDYLSKDDVVKYEPYEAIKTVDEARNIALERSNDHNFLAVTLLDGKLIGNIYFSKGDFDTWEVGYVFNSDYWHKGYATEAMHMIMQYAFTNLSTRRIVAMCNPDNVLSWHLLERLGFRREGHLLKNIYFNKDASGKPIWQDTYEYGILKEEFK